MGISLQDRESDDASKRRLFAETVLYGPDERGMIDGRMRLMWTDDEDSYRRFDLDHDPGELMDVAADYPRRVQPDEEAADRMAPADAG